MFIWREGKGLITESPLKEGQLMLINKYNQLWVHIAKHSSSIIYPFYKCLLLFRTVPGTMLDPEEAQLTDEEETSM